MGLFGAKLSELISLSLFATVRNDRHTDTTTRLKQTCGLLCSVLVLSLFSLFPFVHFSNLFGGFATGFLLGMVIFAKYIEDEAQTVVWGCLGFVGLVLELFCTLYAMYEGDDLQLNVELSDVCEYFAVLYNDGYECTCS